MGVKVSVELRRLRLEIAGRVNLVIRIAEGRRKGARTAEMLGVPARTWSAFMAGETSLRADAILRFLLRYRVEVPWLLRGEGRMFRAETSADELRIEQEKRERLVRAIREALDDQPSYLNTHLPRAIREALADQPSYLNTHLPPTAWQTTCVPCAGTSEPTLSAKITAGLAV
ncbi:MAG: hypothetical protein ACYDCI_00270 [Candidatus Limnocylindrales bacterium]